MIRGERLIKLSNSWFSAKSILVEFFLFVKQVHLDDFFLIKFNKNSYFINSLKKKKKNRLIALKS